MVLIRGYYKTFSRIQRINEENTLLGVGGNASYIHKCSRVHDAIYVLVTNRYATYRELKDAYTIDEFLDLYEICMVNLYNKYEITENLKEERKR